MIDIFTRNVDDIECLYVKDFFEMHWNNQI